MSKAAMLPLSVLLCSASIASAFVEPATSVSVVTATRGTSSNVAAFASWNKPISRRNNFSKLRMTEDDENNPLARGINSVTWLPSVYDSSPSRSVFDSATADDNDNGEEDGELTETLPLFPLGGIVYTPNSEHILNIFEPRYRQMYNDILMNGSKRFVVSMCHPSEEGRFAQVGVLFSLEELKEVSEMTEDQVKYICNHRVTGRVKLHKVLNPEAWDNRDTYLKVKGTIIDDTGAFSESDDEDDEDGVDENISSKLVSAMKKAIKADEIEKSPEEEALVQSFTDLVELQHDLSEDVRFTRASIKSFGVAEGTDADPNLWTSIRLWQSYAEQRLVGRQNEMQKEFQEKLVEYLKKEMGNENAVDDDLPSAIGFEDLSPELQTELVDLQKRMSGELQPLLLEQTLSMQKILEAADHDERVDLVRYFVDAERKRLQAKKILKSMFGGEPSAVASKEAPAPAPPKVEEESNSQFFEDDGDAFQ